MKTAESKKIYSEEIQYTISESILAKGFVAYQKQQDSIPKPVVMIAHDWGGRDVFYCNLAKEIASLGYVGFAVDMFGDAKIAQTIDEKRALIEPLKQDPYELLRRIQSAYDYISELPYMDKQKVAALGYCFGGRCVLDFARAGVDIKGVVSFHGLLDSPAASTQNIIKSKILILHGYEDPFVKPEQVLSFADEMTQKKADWQIHMYGHTRHSFTKPGVDHPAMGLKYDPIAQKRAWEASKYFLQEIFGLL